MLHCEATLGWTQSELMRLNFGMNHATGAGSLTPPVDLQSSVLQLPQTNTRKCTKIWCLHHTMWFHTYLLVISGQKKTKCSFLKEGSASLSSIIVQRWVCNKAGHFSSSYYCHALFHNCGNMSLSPDRSLCSCLKIMKAVHPFNTVQNFHKTFMSGMIKMNEWLVFEAIVLHCKGLFG